MKIKVNGIEMFYEVYGSGRPLIMVHGNGEDHTVFHESMVLLRKYFTVYTVDSRGHGISSRVDELHYSDMADDMIAFMEELDLKDVVFYGFSDGGIIGLMAAAKTDRISMLITSGANTTPAGVKSYMRLLVKVMYKVTKDPKLLMMLNEPDITAEQLAEIKIPVVVIAGENDLVLREDTAKIADSIPGAKMRIIPGEGHGSYIVNKSRIADIILEETGMITPDRSSDVTVEQMKTLIKAQQGEMDAVYMYKRLAKTVREDKDREAFLRLAGDEARHADVFFRYTGKVLKANPAKGIVVPLMYRTLGRKKTYPVIAKGEYEAADKYRAIIADFPEAEAVMNDENIHGDAVLGLLD